MYRPMIKLLSLSVLISINLFVHDVYAAAVALPWSTSYSTSGQCNEWTQANGLSNVNCDDLKGWGGWTCDNGDSTVREEQITSAANHAAGGGGRGQRHQLGDGINNGSGGLYVEWTPKQQEVWVRWYMRYQAGFKWNILNYNKILYFDVNTKNSPPNEALDIIVEWYGADQSRIHVQSVAGGQSLTSPAGVGGWQSTMGGAVSDGLWHLYEVHLKMDTNGSNGVAEMWIDDTRVINYTNVNFGTYTSSGWSYVLIGSNIRDPLNGQCFVVDFDDIKISNTGYIGGIIDTIAPADITSFASVAGDAQVSLSWANPTDYDFAGTKILRKIGSAPSSCTDGTATTVYNSTGTSYVDTVLVNGTTYYYLACSFDEVPNYSSGIVVSNIPVTQNVIAGDITLPLSTAYNCPTWTQTAGTSTSVGCSNFSIINNVTCGSGVGLEQITTDANNSRRSSAKGQRHWKGDAANESSGGFNATFATQTELWIRLYMRYEKGFSWSTLQYDKIISVNSVVANKSAVVQWVGTSEFNINAQNSGGLNKCVKCGWNYIMGGATSDGLWHVYEVHLKMDTNGANGIAEMWIDGNKVMKHTQVNFGTSAGWNNIDIGLNQIGANNGRCMYVDFDDIKISTTGYIGVL